MSGPHWGRAPSTCGSCRSALGSMSMAAGAPVPVGGSGRSTHDRLERSARERHIPERREDRERHLHRGRLDRDAGPGGEHLHCSIENVTFEPGVNHWHGTASESWLVHLAFVINAGEGRAEWLEPVTDEAYRGLPYWGSSVSRWTGGPPEGVWTTGPFNRPRPRSQPRCG